MQPPRRPFDIEDYGMMNHAIDYGSGDYGITEVIAQFLEVDICGYHG